MSFDFEDIYCELGEIKCDVNEICKKLSIDYEKLVQKTGFTAVYRTNKDLIEFIKNIIQKTPNIIKSNVIILVNQSSSNQIPGLTPHIFADLEASTNIKFFEISDACTGFITALKLADTLIKDPDIYRISIITAEKYSDFIDMSNTKISTLFSDSVTICTIIKNENKVKILSDNVNNSFQLNENFILKDKKIDMNGLAIFEWVTKNVNSHIESLLKKSKIHKHEVGYWFIHQGSKIVVDSIVSTLKLDPGRYFKAGNYGNLVSGSIPRMLKDFIPLSSQKFKENYVVLLSFGVGLSMKSIVLKINN